MDRQRLRVDHLDAPDAARGAPWARLDGHGRALGADYDSARLRKAQPGRCRREQLVLALRVAAVDPDLPHDLLGAAAMKTERMRDRFMPWGGLALGTLGAGFAHQLGADATFQDCRYGSPLIVIIGTIVGLALVGIGALGSWRVYSSDS